MPDAYAWKRAEGLPAGSYSGVVAGPGGSIIAAAEGSNPMTGLYGLFRGEFSLGTLFMTRASISGIDAKKMERTVVAVCDRTPSVLYAACGGAGDRLLAVLRSADGGYSWTACGLSVDGDPKGSTLPDLAGNQSRYNNAIDVSPVDERVVALGWRNGPWISTNRGQTWLPKGMGWSGDSWRFTSPHLHSDVHAVSFDRTDPIGRRLYVATDGGVAFTPDLGETFTSAGNEQLATLQFQSFPARAYVGSLAASGGAANVVAGGLQDNGDVVGAIAAGTPWQQFAGGDGMLVSWLGTGQILYQTNRAVALRSGSWTGTTISGGGVVPINVTKSGGPADLGGLGPPAGDVTLATIAKPVVTNAAGERMYAVAATGADVYGLFADAKGAAIHWEYLASAPTRFGETIRAVGSRDGKTILIGTSLGRIFGRDADTGFMLEHEIVARPAAAGSIPGSF